MGFAENLRYLRKKKKYSQEFVAAKLGYKSYTTIQKWETNNAEPSLEKLHEIADMFGVEMDMLVNGVVENNELVLSTKTTPLSKYSTTHQRIVKKIGLLNETELIFVESIIDSYLEKKNK